MTSPPRIPRKTNDLVDSLKRHLKLLEQFSSRAFGDRDEDYLGEVAGKLRVLVYEKGRNKPLLLSLMDEFDIKISITLGGPPLQREPGQPSAGDRISLRDYLMLTAYGIRTKSGFISLTKHELIGIWAQENGSAHEDWCLDEPYSVARGFGLFIGGHSVLAAELKVTTETVLHVGKEALEGMKPELFPLKDADRQLRMNPNSEDAQNELGIALANLGEDSKALKTFDDILKQKPTFAKAHNNKGLVQLRSNELNSARESFEQATALKPDYVDAFYNLACVYSRMGIYDKCLELLARVKALDQFKGIAPGADSDLTGIRNDPAWGPKFSQLLK